MLEKNLRLVPIHFVLFVPEFELSFGPQADRADHRVLTQFLLVITVPGDPVFSIPVIIDQHGIKGHARVLFDRLFDLDQIFGPWFRVHVDTRIGVGFPGVPVPGFQSGNQAFFAIEADRILGPFNLIFQVKE